LHEFFGAMLVYGSRVSPAAKQFAPEAKLRGKDYALWALG